MHTGAGYIGTDQIAAGCNFINLVDIDDAVVGQFDIIVCFPYQIANKILHIATDITGFAEFGRISFDEGYTDFIGNQFDNIGLADTGRPDHQNVVLYAAHHTADGVFRFHGALNAIEVRAYFGCQNGFGAVLFDDVLIQVGNEFLRL